MPFSAIHLHSVGCLIYVHVQARFLNRRRNPRKNKRKNWLITAVCNHYLELFIQAPSYSSMSDHFHRSKALKNISSSTRKKRNSLKNRRTVPPKSKSHWLSIFVAVLICYILVIFCRDYSFAQAVQHIVRSSNIERLHNFVLILL